MSSKIKFDLANFESLSEDSSNQLVGGFSASVSLTLDSASFETNNCNGGNCVDGCGATNNGCNVVENCGGSQFI